jgi:hypothetical protein
VNTKRIFGSTGRYYLARASVFLLSVALIIGMASCGPVTQYSLTISSTEGGEVTHPGEATFTYDEGTVVNLVAEADDGYLFADWTGDVGTVADVNAGSTTITMSGNYSVTANFTPKTSQNLEIRTWYDLDAVRDNFGGNHTLLNDLSAATAGYEELASPTANEGKGWEPIGNWEHGPFWGTFDGQGHEIRDLCIDRPDESSVGLFGAQKGLISNICLTEVTVRGCCDVGAMAGSNCGIIENSCSGGHVTGYQWVGGMVGFNNVGVIGCCFTGSVAGNHTVGGLVGYHTYDNVIGGAFMADPIGADAYSIPYVTSDWCPYIVSDCYAAGNVSGTSCVGGLVGYIYYGGVLDSYSTGSVAGDSSVGGLVGFNYNGPVLGDSFWDTETSGQATSDGGTGKNTTEMKNIATFTDVATEGLDVPWDMIAVASSAERNPSHIWNIVDGLTYPFLSWQSI